MRGGDWGRDEGGNLKPEFGIWRISEMKEGGDTCGSGGTAVSCAPSSLPV